jgi:hypothetical protein
LINKKHVYYDNNYILKILKNKVLIKQNDFQKQKTKSKAGSETAFAFPRV